MTDGIFDISERLVHDYVELSPMLATSLGMPGHNDRWDDLTPAGRRRQQDLATHYRRLVADHLDDPVPGRRQAAEVIAGFLDTEISEYESGDYLYDVAHVYCGLTHTRNTFDIMATDTAQDWADITARLATIGDAWQGWTELLAQGVTQGKVAARRQVESVIEQAEALAGDGSRFVDLARQAAEGGHDTDALESAIARAREEAAHVAAWLRTEYLPHAPIEDGVGRDRYVRAAERFLGKVIDPEEAYEWAWAEISRLNSEMEVEATRIDPDRSLPEVLELLDTAPDRSVPISEFCSFVEGLLMQAVEDLDGTHFDVPAPIREVTVNLAPPGGALGAWYVSPSVDWSRPGSVWYAHGAVERVPTWQEAATAYHEGFPGHHLQVGTAMAEADHLTLAHRLLIWYSGYGEGWALYAERLMDELGYFDRPEFRLGLLASQQFRATRVVVDIGSHLDFAIPAGAPLHAGERWDYDRAVDYMQRVGLQPHQMAESEVKRYLGWPGQAISYKLGEREILDIRHTLEQRGDFDLRDFHRRVLVGGPLRLDQLRRRLVD